tara:strand:+ start:698 stop:871 length:174 start_codon:yes stop_codon:yes gene_type:complete
MFKNYSKFVNLYRAKSQKNGPARFGQYPKPSAAMTQYPKPSAAMTQRLRLERKGSRK